MLGCDSNNLDSLKGTLDLCENFVETLMVKITTASCFLYQWIRNFFLTVPLKKKVVKIEGD